LKQRDVRRLKTAQMKFMIHREGYNLLEHRKKKQGLLEELSVDPIRKKNTILN
jgi:hypothetical protein